MKLLDVFLIGLALSMDAFAITIANCTTYKSSLNKKKEWSMPIFFSIFQGVMPLLGFFIGSLVAGYIDKIAGYITAGIFFLLSLKIVIDNLKEIFSKGKDKKEKSAQELTYKMLFLQAIATSIDALVVGITFIELTFSVYFAVLIVASVTFIMITIALFFGKYLGKLFGKYAEWLGAIILLALAIKSLVETLI